MTAPAASPSAAPATQPSAVGQPLPIVEPTGVGTPLSVSLYRYDPSSDAAPRYESFTVPQTPGMRVLDVLDYIYEQMDHSFAYRWFCGTKRCGGCGVTVNGKAVLGCWEAATPSMKIEPLRHLPLIRDLVVDFTENEQQLTSLHPVLVRDEPSPGFPEPITHPQMKAHFDLMACIDCRVCVAACSVLDKPGHEAFAGPYALVQLAKIALDPRNGKDMTNAILDARIDLCHSCNDCTEACPNDVPVLAGAIDPLRQQLISSGAYRVPAWAIIRRLPTRLRSFLHCRLGISSWTRIVRPKSS
jgi:succinate dehydrogenase/fumarate reductase iron-sulfur protein